MGATTFSMSKRNRARKAREAGKIEEAEVLDKSSNKFKPGKKHLQMSNDPVSMKDEETEVDDEVEEDE